LEIPGGYKVKKELENSEKQIKTGVFHRHTTVAISWIASLRAVPTPTPKLQPCKLSKQLEAAPAGPWPKLHKSSRH